jgi:ABC-type transport system substrate-binding protein
MRRSFPLLALVLSVILFILPACAPSAPPPTPTSAPQPTSAPLASATSAPPPTSAPAAAVDGGTLIIALPKDMVTLDPTFALDNYSVEVIDQIFDTLVTLKSDSSIQPRLATSWKAVSDKVYEFTLRKGVKFHNGRVMTADDVVWTMNRMLDPKTKVPRQQLFMVDKVEKVSDDVVRFTLNQAYAPFLSAMANRALSILPKEEVEKYGENFARNPVGTGPFKFISWKSGEGVTLERNPDYFFGKPHLEKVIIKPIPETVVAQQQLETGDVDVIADAMPDDIVRLQNAGLLQLVPGQSYYYIVFNLKADSAPIVKTLGKNPFTDKKVREAIVLAFPVTDAIQAVYPGLASQIQAFGPIPNSNWAYDPELAKTWPKPDLAKAKQLLADAGYPNGFNFKMEILSMSDAPRKAIAQILQSSLSKIGIEASIVAPEMSILLGRANDQTFDIGVFGWGGTPDPHDYVFPLLHTSRRGSGGNNAWYSNPDVDKLIDEAAVSTDQAARKALYNKVQEIFMADLVHIPLYYKPSILGVSKRVQGLKVDPLGYFQLVTADANVSLKPVQ